MVTKTTHFCHELPPVSTAVSGHAAENLDLHSRARLQTAGLRLAAGPASHETRVQHPDLAASGLAAVVAHHPLVVDHHRHPCTRPAHVYNTLRLSWIG